MFSPARVFYFVLNLAVFALLALVGSSPLVVVPALAAPIPSPMVHTADFAPRPLQNATTPVARDILTTIEEAGGITSGLPRRELRNRDITTVLGDLNVLNNYYNGMQQHAANFRTLARQPASSRSSDFQAQSAAELTGFQTNLLGFQTILDQLGSDDGLANYDKNNEVETILKEMVNSVKYLLTDTDDMVYSLPAVGQTLGPIVYEIKCILDKVLDAVENLTDAILNAIQPLLAPLIGQATDTACRSGLQIAGLCLLV
ncbi:hypothetical protein NM688_g6358 [Phlebia brevispora]|uniref:Uncharacterized protein n=1 Tax=Phlebia brevispora TaxID=194682 RepID=A0ACC1SGS5_9APHY|nr:hypothetical protein NM688_g6358 [Phlebia brevispora]